MPETLKTETCVRCGIDLDEDEIGKTTLCCCCDYDLERQEQRMRRREPPVALQRPCSPELQLLREDYERLEKHRKALSRQLVELRQTYDSIEAICVKLSAKILEPEAKENDLRERPATPDSRQPETL